MPKKPRILYLDAILIEDSADCLYEGTREGFMTSPQYQKAKALFERISIHPDRGQKPAKVFRQLARENLAGLVLSGSEKSVPHADRDPWVADYLEGLEVFLREWRTLENPYPILAICFAHQAIAQVWGGEVRPSGKLKIGPVEVRSLDHNLLPPTKDWQKFIAFHEDQVKVPPRELRPWLTSDYCEYQGFVHPQLPLVTVQFHPEMNEKILDVSSDKELWSRCSKKDFNGQRGNDLLAYFVDWLLKAKR